ncbi:SDR family NAD(P)-dependent oxidoreductase [Novosphingobium tardum]|uniref:SDR family NAD(P)-dependent oxidoreductase n=1 Tax=Novosphingobium tardum TaxID=1538021 RepID=A0ABV8RRJ3_9SPHN
MDIKGKTALITGAAAGIGRATAIAFAERGATRLLIADVDEAGLAETARLAAGDGTRVDVCKLDVTDSDAFAALFDGDASIDIVFNNAGIVSGPPPYPGTPIKRIELLVAINLTSVIVGTTLAVRHMQAHGRGGAIVNTASTGALNPYIDDAPYAASKAGVVMFSRSCGALKDRDGIRVNAVLPGVTETPILEKLGGGERPEWLGPIMEGIRIHQPSDIAAAVVRIVEDDEMAGDYVTLSNDRAAS